MKLDYYDVDYRVRRGIVVLFEDMDYNHHRCLVSMLRHITDYYAGWVHIMLSHKNAVRHFNGHFGLFVELGDVFSER